MLRESIPGSTRVPRVGLGVPPKPQPTVPGGVADADVPPSPAGEPSNSDPTKPDVVDADFEVVDDDKKKR
jgi:hypothetical protein